MKKMKRCPNCGMFSVEYNPRIGFERCMWKDCLWINKDNKDLDNEHYKYNIEELKKIFKQRRITI